MGKEKQNFTLYAKVLRSSDPSAFHNVLRAAALNVTLAI